MEKLLYPFRYFKLTNRELKVIDALPTTLLSLIIAVPFFAIPDANFFGVGGFVNNITTLTAALTGFYVAALVAAATFSHPDLDKVMTSGAVSVDGVPLTRREFVCTMFGYLAFSAMAFTIFAAAVVPLASALPAEIRISLYWNFDLRGVLSVIGTFIASAWISHIFVVTCLGLYYLMDRLHRRDKKVVTPAPEKRAA